MNRNSAQLPTSLPTHQPPDIPPSTYLQSVWQRGGGGHKLFEQPRIHISAGFTHFGQSFLARSSEKSSVCRQNCGDSSTCLYNQWIFYGEHWKHKKSMSIDFQVKHFKGSQTFNYRISEKMPVCTFWFLIPLFLFYFYFYQTQVLSLSLLVANKLAHVVKTLPMWLWPLKMPTQCYWCWCWGKDLATKIR